MPATDRITVVLRAKEGETLDRVSHFAQLGAPVAIGHGLGIIASASQGDMIEESQLLTNQIVIAEAAMRRGALMRDEDHVPVLKRVIDHIMQVAVNVADEVKETYLEEDNDEQEARDRAGQALRVAAMIKIELQKLLEPDLLTAIPVAVPEPHPVVAETPYCEVRIKSIDEWIRTVQNAKRYEFLRNEVWDTPHNQLAPTDSSGALIIEQELDDEIDNAMRLTRQVQNHGEPV